MNKTEVQGIFALIVLSIIVIYLRQIIGRYIIVYKIKKDGISISYFGIFPIMKVKYNNIKNIYKTSLNMNISNILSITIVNRISKEPVIIEKKKAFVLFRTIIISPDNPDQFIEKVLENMKCFKHYQ